MTIGERTSRYDAPTTARRRGRFGRLARCAGLAVAASCLVLIALLAACAQALSGDATAAVLELRGTLGEARVVAVRQDD